MSVKIVVDSASEFSYEEAKALGLYFCPLSVSFGDTEYRDSIDIDNKTFYEMLEASKDLPKTSQVGPLPSRKPLRKLLKMVTQPLQSHCLLSYLVPILVQDLLPSHSQARYFLLIV